MILVLLESAQGVLLKNFQRMHGGEIFVPKIPSIHITDLAESLSPGIDINIIGIRPGEKLHETMCPADDSHLTLEFDDHYVIQPSIRMSHSKIYKTNNIGEKGTAVAQGFEYSSGENHHFLSIEELSQLQ